MAKNPFANQQAMKSTPPKMKLDILYACLTLIVVTGTILILPEIHIGIAYYIRILLLLGLMIDITLFFRRLFFDQRFGNRAKNLGAAVYPTIILLLILEIFFMFLPRSSGFGSNLASQLWYKRYWKPLNSYGYRDIEPITGKAGNKNIFFLGDSFTVGLGINNTRDRFSNVFKQMITLEDTGIHAINLGQIGVDTKKEFELMTNFIGKSGIHPDCIVLQYFGNDIEKVAFRHGLNLPKIKPYRRVPPVIQTIIKGSYLVNYFYPLFSSQDTQAYINLLQTAYSTESIFKEHLHDLNAFIEFSHTEKVPLLVVLFPFMQDIQLSKELYLTKLIHFLKDNHVEYVDVSAKINDLTPAKRVVNSNDKHASVIVNHRIGAEIVKWFKKTMHKE